MVVKRDREWEKDKKTHREKGFGGKTKKHVREEQNNKGGSRPAFYAIYSNGHMQTHTHARTSTHRQTHPHKSLTLY